MIEKSNFVLVFLSSLNFYAIIIVSNVVLSIGRGLDIYFFLWYNDSTEYVSPEAEHRSVQMPD